MCSSSFLAATILWASIVLSLWEICASKFCTLSHRCENFIFHGLLGHLAISYRKISHDLENHWDTVAADLMNELLVTICMFWEAHKIQSRTSQPLSYSQSETKVAWRDNSTGAKIHLFLLSSNSRLAVSLSVSSATRVLSNCKKKWVIRHHGNTALCSKFSLKTSTDTCQAVSRDTTSQSAYRLLQRLWVLFFKAMRSRHLLELPSSSRQLGVWVSETILGTLPRPSFLVQGILQGFKTTSHHATKLFQSSLAGKKLRDASHQINCMVQMCLDYGIARTYMFLWWGQVCAWPHPHTQCWMIPWSR